MYVYVYIYIYMYIPYIYTGPSAPASSRIRGPVGRAASEDGPNNISNDDNAATTNDNISSTNDYDCNYYSNDND